MVHLMGIQTINKITWHLIVIQFQIKSFLNEYMGSNYLMLHNLLICMHFKKIYKIIIKQVGIMQVI